MSQNQNEETKKQKADRYINLRLFARKGIANDVDFQVKRPVLGGHWNWILNAR